MTPALLTVAAVAERLNVSLRTVRGWIAAGRLDALRLGPRCVRIDERALARFLAEAQR